jgi:hypothetical protein
MRTIYGNIKKCFIVRTQSTYESRAIAAIHKEYSLNIINCLVFMIQAGCVLCEVGA